MKYLHFQSMRVELSSWDIDVDQLKTEVMNQITTEPIINNRIQVSLIRR